VLLKVLN